MKGLKRQWRMEGICQYSGGYISTWDDKCLDCDMIKDYHLKAIHKLLFSDIINVLLSGIIAAVDKQTQKGLYRFLKYSFIYS